MTSQAPPAADSTPDPALGSGVTHHDVRFVADVAALRAACTDLSRATRIAVDVESNGLFAYEPSLCVLQLADERTVYVVDTLALPVEGLVAPLRALFGEGGPLVVVHDLGFDARMLAKVGAPLSRVVDTALAASLLGRTSTGLGSVLESELGVRHDKTLQHHDWGSRPLDARAIEYLAGDVRYLLPLADSLLHEVTEKGLRDELAEETRYRLSEACDLEGQEETRPPFLRMKGKERVDRADLPLLRALAEAREKMARELDVPVFKLLPNDVLFAVAHQKPRTMNALSRIPGAHRGRGQKLSQTLLELVGKTHPPLTRDEVAALAPKRLPPSEVKARKKREAKLLAWRKAEAHRRDVSPQVVLPGHVLREMADTAPETVDDLANLPGFGAFRVARYGAKLVELLDAPDDGQDGPLSRTDSPDEDGA